MAEEKRIVPKRISQTVINSLKGGVVPRIGLPYIAAARCRYHRGRRGFVPLHRRKIRLGKEFSDPDDTELCDG